MAKRTKSGKDKKVHKKWYPVIAPAMFKEQVIGEMPATDISKLLKRNISINLMSATRDFRHQDTTLKFLINSVSGQTAQASLVSYTLSPSSMKRMIRRRTDRIDVRVDVKTKSGLDAVIKVVLVTLNNTVAGVRTKIRNKAITEVKELCKKISFVELVQQLTRNKFQKELKSLVTKVYPVRYIIIKKYTLVADPKEEPVQSEVGSPKSEEKKSEVGSPKSEEKKSEVGSPKSEEKKSEVGSPKSEEKKSEVGSPKSEEKKSEVGSPKSEEKKSEVGSPKSEEKAEAKESEEKKSEVESPKSEEKAENLAKE